MTQTDFEINYDLPYMMEIYNYIHESFPIFKTDTSDSLFKYSKLVDFVNYITNNDTHVDVCLTRHSIEYKPDFEELDVVKKWMHNTSLTNDSISIMKLMLIMKYFEEINLSKDISNLFHLLPPSKLMPSDKFTLLSGCILNDDNNTIDHTYPFKMENTTDSDTKYDSNIPSLLYESICIGTSYYFNKMSDYRYKLTFDNIECIYGPVKFCYMYATAKHSTSTYKNPYYEFVYEKLFEPFKEHYGYPFNKTDMINAVNDCNNRTNFDDFIYTT